MVARFANLFSQERWKASRHGIARTHALSILVYTAVRYSFISGGGGEGSKSAVRSFFWLEAFLYKSTPEY